MRRLLFSVLFCSLLSAASAGAEVVSVPAVQSVDFYPAGARFVFNAHVEGDFEFRVPGAFDPQSVRFLKPDGVHSLKVDTVAVAQEMPKALLPLKDAIAEKKRELRRQESRSAALMQILDFLRMPISGDMKDPELIARLDAGRETRLRYEFEMADMEDAVEKAMEELRKAEEAFSTRLAELQAHRPRNDTQALRIAGTASVPCVVVFEAWTAAAGWNVRYDMNLNSATGVLAAAMQARAWQQTGLDIRGELTFHTRFPAASVNPPELRPQLVSIGRRPNAGLAGRLPGLPENQVVRTSSEADAPAPAAPPEPSMNASLTDVSLSVTGTLKGDGTPSDIMLGSFELQGSAVLTALPEQSREAWIVVSLDSVPSTLLPGAADLAVDGVSSGRTNIPAFGMQTRLPFGMAPRITSAKKPLIGKTGSSWTGKGILEDGYILEIASSMETEREVLVLDRIPLPVDDRIQLEVRKIDPAPAERDPDNRLTWKLSLKPGETKKIQVEYILRYPGEESLEYR